MRFRQREMGPKLQGAFELPWYEDSIGDADGARFNDKRERIRCALNAPKIVQGGSIFCDFNTQIGRHVPTSQR